MYFDVRYFSVRETITVVAYHHNLSLSCTRKATIKLSVKNSLAEVKGNNINIRDCSCIPHSGLEYWLSSDADAEWHWPADGGITSDMQKETTP